MSYFPESIEPLCSVHGAGSIECEGHVFANITYMIECRQKAEGTCSMSGLIDADWKTAEQIRRARDIVLILETGEEIAVAIVGSDAGVLAIEAHDPIKSCMVQSDRKQKQNVH